MNKCIIYRKQEDTHFRSKKCWVFQFFTISTIRFSFFDTRGALETARPPLFRPWQISWRRPSCSDARTRPWRGVKRPSCRAWRRRGAAGFWRQNLCTNRSIGIVCIYIYIHHMYIYIYVYYFVIQHIIYIYFVYIYNMLYNKIIYVYSIYTYLHAWIRFICGYGHELLLVTINSWLLDP